MTREDLKRRIHAAIDRRAEEIVGIGDQIRRNPELGFKEVKTAELVAGTFGRLGLTPTTGLAHTGVRAEAVGRGGPGPTLALLGELDGLIVTGHPDADPATGAAHACGHNAQIAGMLGAAIGLLDSEAMDHLAGRVVFFAVPAEEGGDLEWRMSQVRAGQLEFPGGKAELIRRGHFDDVDLSMMIHTTPRPEDGKASVAASFNGRIGKTAQFVGRAAHAGSSPHQGVNALYAAHVALAAINAVRETFRDDDAIRVHPVITRGGSQVNVIPADVRMEMYVRGKTAEAILDANRKVDRALRSGAMALGASVEIDTLPGPLPVVQDPTLLGVFKDNAIAVVGAAHYREVGHRSGVTDMGDVSHIMPVVHPFMGGASGSGHGANFQIVDTALAYIAPAKVLAGMVVDMLWDGAAGARDVLARAQVRMTRAAYLSMQRSIFQREVYTA